MTSVYRFRWYSVGVAVVALALFLLAFVAPTGAAPTTDRRAPDLGACQNLQAPAGNKVAFHVYAEGVQIYRWNGTSWTFVAPDAVLYANAGAMASSAVTTPVPPGRASAAAKWSPASRNDARRTRPLSRGCCSAPYPLTGRVSSSGSPSSSG